MDQAQIEFFRLKYQILLIEKLVLKLAFAMPVLTAGLSADESRKELKRWLDLNTKVVDAASGEYFHEPAMAGIYADEAKDVVDQMKAEVDELAKKIRDL